MKIGLFLLARQRLQRLLQHRVQRKVHGVGDPVKLLDRLLGRLDFDPIAPRHVPAGLVQRLSASFAHFPRRRYLTAWETALFPDLVDGGGGH